MSASLCWVSCLACTQIAPSDSSKDCSERLIKIRIFIILTDDYKKAFLQSVPVS